MLASWTLLLISFTQERVVTEQSKVNCGNTATFSFFVYLFMSLKMVLYITVENKCLFFK